MLSMEATQLKLLYIFLVFPKCKKIIRFLSFVTNDVRINPRINLPYTAFILLLFATIECV